MPLSLFCWYSWNRLNNARESKGLRTLSKIIEIFFNVFQSLSKFTLIKWYHNIIESSFSSIFKIFNMYKSLSKLTLIKWSNFKIYLMYWREGTINFKIFWLKLWWELKTFLMYQPEGTINFNIFCMRQWWELDTCHLLETSTITLNLDSKTHPSWLGLHLLLFLHVTPLFNKDLP